MYRYLYVYMMYMYASGYVYVYTYRRLVVHHMHARSFSKHRPHARTDTSNLSVGEKMKKMKERAIFRAQQDAFSKVFIIAVDDGMNMQCRKSVLCMPLSCGTAACVDAAASLFAQRM